jgi:hypothetical protein
LTIRIMLPQSRVGGGSGELLMEYFSVSSSTIQSVGYEAETMTLAVSFNDGREYHYSGVPPEVIEQLRVAPSAGRFLNEQIKKAGYTYTRVR